MTEPWVPQLQRVNRERSEGWLLLLLLLLSKVKLLTLYITILFIIWIWLINEENKINMGGVVGRGFVVTTEFIHTLISLL